ncbi:MAG: TIGR01777 family protein [Deltaproteobacteria bacterium]|nr:MAG: TIGR01777 family protein [Deltaproteobacteria bacterium]
MPESRYESEIPVSADTLYAWHARPGAFERLVPPWERVRLRSRTGGVATGARVEMDLLMGPIALRWEAEHVAHEEGRGFTDVARRSPFASWRHVHRFEPVADASCVLRDVIDWRLPLGPLGALGNGFARGAIDRMFRFRHRRTEFDLMRHERASGPVRTIAVTGASGLIGSALVAYLRAGGHRVRPLVRRAPGDADEIRWSPSEGEIDREALSSVDAVVHLAGESIAGGRWTEARKSSIRDSRVVGTDLLARALAEVGGPRVLLSASAIGFYGDVPEGRVGEDSPRGEGFLADVCAAWEGAADPARAAGLRVVHPRIGVVLAAGGGALATMLPAFRAGVGGVVGSGRQWMSWIGLEDVVGALHFLLESEGISGPVNLTAPEPVTNREFTRTLGRVLRRPTLLPLPAPAVRLLLGEMGEKLLLEGAAVEPRVLRESGFVFMTPGLEQSMRHELGRDGP